MIQAPTVPILRGWFGGGFFFLPLWGSERAFLRGTIVNSSNFGGDRCNGAEGLAEGFTR